MRIVARLLVLLPLLWVEGVWAVDCSSDDYYLTSQAEVDALGATQCDTVRGTLFIGGATADITDLDALTHLRAVGGDLILRENPILTDIDGLAGLLAVGGSLNISRNSVLIHIDSLKNLSAVGQLYIVSNPNLVSLDGLLNVGSVAAELRIEVNNSLTDLDGLSNVTTIGGGLVIGGNDALQHIDGLANVVTIGRAGIPFDRGLSITTNKSLTDLNGLSSVSKFAGGIFLNGSPVLSDISGLKGLAKDTLDYLSINDNDMLQNLTVFTDVTSITGELVVAGNMNLQDCRGVAPLLGFPVGEPDDEVGGRVVIVDNAVGCDTLEQVLLSVSGPTQPVITEATTSSNSISLALTPSTTTDTLFPVTGYSASCTGSEVDVSGSPATDLLDNTPITETLAVVGYDPTSVLSSIEVDLDITHSDPTDLYITLTTPEGTELILWNQGSSGGEDLVGTFPTSLTSVDSFEAVSSGSMDGDWVLSIEDIDVGPLVREGVLNSWGLRISEEVTASGTGSPIEVTGITQGREYQCRVAPVTKLGKVPESEPFIVNPSATTVFIRLLDTVLRITHRLDSQSAMDSGRSSPPQARAGEEEVEKPNAIPTLPMLGLFILSGLIGLFGIRRFALQ